MYHKDKDIDTYNSGSYLQTACLSDSEAKLSYSSLTCSLEVSTNCYGASFKGDSGGPLQCKQGSKWVQAGIASFGIPCALAGYPEVYGRVSAFEDWIRQHLAGTSVEFVTYTMDGTDQDSSFVCRSNGTLPSSSSTYPQTAVLVFVISQVTVFLQLD